MTNNNFHISRRVLLPLLFCSAAVLAGDGGLDAPYGQMPESGALTLEDDLAPEATCDSGNPARGDCPDLAVGVATENNMKLAAAPDTMQQAQQLGNEADGFIDDAHQAAMPGINTGYVGGRTRLGIGIDSEFKTKTDVSHIFSETEDSALIGQGYLGLSPKKDENLGYVTGAGAKINYHWVSKDEDGQASYVNKVFGAYDQNGKSDKDGNQGKKVTVGYGQERENMFWSGSVMKGVSKKFDTGEKDINGNVIYEKAYDWGVGGRVGTYLPEQQMRIQGGLDYEWGTEHADNESKAKQVTLTGGVEKFFPDSPHSINANLDVYKKSGGYEEGDQKAKVRGGIGYRYDIASENAGVWQADKMYRRIRTEIPGEVIKTPPKVERKLVKHTMELESDTFFKIDSARLTPEAQTRLQAVIAQMRASGHEGNIRITGSTCDIGSTAHNQALSERRANSVRSFLIQNGFNGDELIAQGLGETSPKYPNTPEERHKNRRVDIEYVTYQNEYKDQVIQQGGTTRTDPKVVWKQELIPTPPLWVRQALHNVADHKQRVDTYKTTAGGGGAVCTTPTQANNDSGTGYDVDQDSTDNELNVLDNDTACDKDTTKITDVQGTSDQGGTVTISSDGKTVIYTPKEGFSGEDTFTYTITDKDGNTSTATVTVVVNNSGTCTTVTQANDDSGTGYDVDQNSSDNTLNVLDNDATCDKDTTKITDVQGTSDQGGTVTISGDGKTVIYTPKEGFTGTDTFVYTITDKDGNTSTANVTVVVNATGSCSVPAAADDGTFDATVGKESVIDTLLDNDTICDNSETVIDEVSCNGTQAGLSIDSDGKTVRFTPPDGTVSGEQSCSYTLKDKDGNTSTANFTVNITGDCSTGSGGCACPTTDFPSSYSVNLNSGSSTTFDMTDYVSESDVTVESFYAVVQDSSGTPYTVVEGNGQAEIYTVDELNNHILIGVLEVTGNKVVFNKSGDQYCTDPAEIEIRIKLQGCDEVAIPVSVSRTSA